MAKNLVTAIELRLKDGFSRGIQRAGSATSGFAKDTIGAINTLDKALSGTAAKFAAFGVSLSVGAATSDMIALDHRLTRLGLTANASSEQIVELKQKIYETALELKIGTDSLVDAAMVNIERVGDFEYLSSNLRNMGLLLQATGESGEAAGNIFSALAAINYNDEETLRFLDNLDAIGDTGAFTLGAFAQGAGSIISTYGQIGTEVEDLASAMKVLQIMMRGINAEDETMTAFRSIINELNTKEDALLKLGIRVRNQETGKLRDLQEVMTDIAARAELKGNAQEFFKLFGIESMKGVLAFITHAKTMNGEFEKLGDTSGSLERKAEAMAQTMQSNLQNLQTAFNRFADTSLTKPLAEVTELLNRLAEDPQNIERIFEAIAKGLVAITAVKGIAGVSRLIGSFGQLKSGKVNITESLSMATAMPVYVTNWSGGSSMPIGAAGSVQGTPSSTLLDQYGNPLPLPSSTPSAGTPAKSPSKSPRGNIPKGVKTLGAAALVADVAFEGYKVYQTVQDIERSELSEPEKEVARSRTIGAATGKTGGEIAGMVLGGLLGSFAGPAGTVVGASIGASILGFLGEKGGEALGRWRAENGEKQKTDTKGHYEYTGVNGLPVWVEPQIPIANLPPQITQTKTDLSPQKVALEGQAVMDVQVDISGERPTAQVAIRHNSIPVRFNTGDNADVWMIP
ncbi:MAG: phage tail tape measure protein [Treponema sp.]|jgi:hypothetical protein|nr:phage tail tape measure protein [Treponema sp.]